MEVEADTGGDAASMDMDLDNVELLDQHPSTISSGREGRTWTKGGGQIQPTELQGTPPASPQPTRPTLAEQSTRALIEFGIIVGVAIMVGSMFMAMVGAELLYDHLCDKVREIFKQQKPAPDIERLHPAELVGTFSRYK